MKHKISFREFLLPYFDRVRAGLTFNGVKPFVKRNFYAIALLVLWLVIFLLKEF